MSDNENRETWQARLWAANDEGLYAMTRDQDADTIRGVFEDALYGPEGDASGLLGDVLGLWLGRVDWDAVADAQRDEDAATTDDDWEVCENPDEHPQPCYCIEPR